MSFWKKLWDRLNTDIQPDWKETIKGGVESADKIFKLAEVWNKKENASLKDLIPYFQQTALVSSNWRLESLQYKRFNKAGEFGVSPPKLILFQ